MGNPDCGPPHVSPGVAVARGGRGPAGGPGGGAAAGGPGGVPVSGRAGPQPAPSGGLGAPVAGPDVSLGVVVARGGRGPEGGPGGGAAAGGGPGGGATAGGGSAGAPVPAGRAPGGRTLMAGPFFTGAPGGVGAVGAPGGGPAGGGVPAMVASPQRGGSLPGVPTPRPTGAAGHWESSSFARKITMVSPHWIRSLCCNTTGASSAAPLQSVGTLFDSGSIWYPPPAATTENCRREQLGSETGTDASGSRPMVQTSVPNLASDTNRRTCGRYRAGYFSMGDLRDGNSCPRY